MNSNLVTPLSENLIFAELYFSGGVTGKGTASEHVFSHRNREFQTQILWPITYIIHSQKM